MKKITEKKPLEFTLLLMVSCAILSGCNMSRELPMVEVQGFAYVEKPDMVKLPSGKVIGTWAIVNSEGLADIVIAELDENRQSWTPPKRLNSLKGSAVAGRQVGPQIATGPNGIIAVSWVDRCEDPSSDIFISVSSDEGNTFSIPLKVNDDRRYEVGQEYHDVAISADGRIHVVWLDERESPPTASNQKQIYYSVSNDMGKSFDKNRALTQSPVGVCPCCQPTLVASLDGSLHLIYRDRIQEKLCIKTKSLPAGGSTFNPTVTLSKGWEFPGCPVNSPTIVGGEKGQVWALWWERERLWWAYSTDNGKTFSEEQSVLFKTDSEGDVLSQLMLNYSKDHGAFATWESSMGQIYFQSFSSQQQSSQIKLSSPRKLNVDSQSIARGHVTLMDGEFLQLCWAIDAFSSSNPEAAPKFIQSKWSTNGFEDSVILVPVVLKENSYLTP